MLLDAILFDFDGTLCDTIPLIVESYQHMYKAHGKRFHQPDEIIAGIGLPLETVIGSEYPTEMPKMLQTYLDYNFKYSITRYGIFLGIGPMLEELKKMNIPMGIVTAKRYENLIPTLEHSGLDQYFEIIVSKNDTDQHKPNPAPLLLGMEKLGYQNPSRIMYVGDAVFDVQAAKNGNFISAIVGWSQSDHDVLRQEKPSYWFDNPSDLTQMIKSLQK
ncbi:MAG: HAD-IA family hydrolase [Clostridiaceae bacterium]|nr:HAD-IA family hydrolase [Clostridiaceae bacterium]